MGVVEVVDHNVKCGQEGVHVEHEGSVPFPWGSGSRPTLERRHLPLKSSIDNSHQAFKGYERADFEDAWSRYLPHPGGFIGNTITEAQSSHICAESSMTNDVTDKQNV